MSGSAETTHTAPWAWCAAAGSLILPLLSNTGYSPVSLEYIVGLALALMAGLGLWRLAGGGERRAASLALLFAISVLLYFGGLASGSLAGSAGVVSAIVLFYLWARRDGATALRILSFVGAAQILSAAVMTPKAVQVFAEATHPRANRPAVVHVLLDESAGLAAYPPDAVSQSDVARIAEFYVSRGFSVFSRAYSADTKTQFAVSRMLNNGLSEPSTALREVLSPYGWHVHRAVALDELAREFVFDLTFTTYVDLRPALRPAHRVARAAAYDGTIASQSLARNGASMGDRTLVAAASTWNWLRAARSPFVTIPTANTAWGDAVTHRVHPMWRTHPLVSHDVLADLQERLACCIERGTYAFAHVLLPHYPYVFDSRCALRPAATWLNNTVHALNDADTLETRRERYRRQFAQAECASSYIGKIADGVAARPGTADTVILVHGDHGSRITIEKPQGLDATRYTAADLERDNRGTFLAVRMPGLPAGIVDTPVRIDDVYTMLVHSGFRTLKLDALPKRTDQPY